MFERYREIQMRRADGESPEHGFTLIELLIVIVVLGILAAIVVFSLTGVTSQSKQAACTSNGKTIEVAADAYQAEVGSYPASSADLTGGATQYLHAWPDVSGQTWSLDTANDTVDVDTGSGPVAYTAAGGCSSLS